uniref:Uncharacterized protein n=1 Tax=Ananas comosus var. bracteatus TaxID=296719 RepID=A0A6V7PEY2_ANACO|nr:unnamed protein product [Ananas comosus var. bracteatus]
MSFGDWYLLLTSPDSEKRKLQDKFRKLRQGDRSVREYEREILPIVNYVRDMEPAADNVMAGRELDGTSELLVMSNDETCSRGGNDEPTRRAMFTRERRGGARKGRSSVVSALPQRPDSSTLSRLLRGIRKEKKRIDVVILCLEIDCIFGS